jgi:hypothetical protein
MEYKRDLKKWREEIKVMKRAASKSTTKGE